MPAKGGGSGEAGGGQGGQRTTFRPPWVKDGPPSLPAPPSAPWLRAREQQAKEKPVPKKQVKLITIQQEKGPSGEADGGQETGQPQLHPPPTVKHMQPPPGPQKPVQQPSPIQKQQPPPPPPQPQPMLIHKRRPNENGKADIKEDAGKPIQRKSRDELRKKSVDEPPVPPTIEDKTRKMSKTEVPPPPPPPPPPALPRPPGIETKPMSVEKAAKLEALKARPRRRPDWTDMMKEVEEGIRLKHVQCNDRSAPVLPMAKAKGQFVYESEKDNVHNQLLKQIQKGVRLKRVKCNDRSKPLLQGLRKFRRQMTIEEQIQKSASVADVVAVATEPDELDDIDKVRDDLQSTKQMLALELRNKEALERENKRLMARLLNLEVELEKEKMAKKINLEKGSIGQTRSVEDDQLITKLKEEASQSTKMGKDMEDMYHKTAEELDVTRAKLESAWLQNSQLEMALKSLEKRGEVIPIVKQPSRKLISSMSNAKPPPPESSSEEETEEEVTETETETEEDDPAESTAQQEKRILRELKFITSKLRNLKDKRATALKEKYNLKDQFSKLHKILRAEKRKYKELQKEVDKMAKLMKDVDGEGEENEEEEDENEDEIEESETESESDETEEEEEESDGDLPESASTSDKINNLKERVRVYETRLTTLKKSNYLLKANIDRRQDDLNRQKEMSLTLQEDLNSVLAELG